MNTVVNIFIGPYTSSGYYTPTESRTPAAAAQDRFISAGNRTHVLLVVCSGSEAEPGDAAFCGLWPQPNDAELLIKDPVTGNLLPSGVKLADYFPKQPIHEDFGTLREVGGRRWEDRSRKSC